ncbi:MAG: beta-phosphoglucomutase family hydrolase [Candidatus Omnitrophica bacterium]|nr:beta-phosphoglucomutase family hydrolase [Candidatus Omnitrophota bacterium]MBU2043661.1 beta-phosphoglucomutase family hydrolase [Candidatus Omnitrophota bacterium]MBU2265645.1 beta-phosphoglucomutase family hydrolase [Candidatus Omnitrophota bacterium]MBU2473973.1 beta-phosphoglucomutase family hydrolase [Candidatus Omnitrophota bacterium]
MEFKGAIFDLDGVIVDTVPLHFKAWKKMFLEYGQEITFQDYKEKIDGIPRISGARAILKDLSEDKLNQAASRKQGYFLEFLEKEGVKVYPSTLELIENLKNQKIKVAVISASKNCRFTLEKAGIDSLFDVIITGNDVKKGKPEPDVFLLAAEKLNLSPEVCIIVEDAVLGVLAAQRAGMRCVGIDRYQNPQRLAKANLVVNDLSEVTVEQLKNL